VGAVRWQNTRRGLPRQHAIAIGKVEQGADVGIRLAIVAAVASLEIPVELGKHVTGVQLHPAAEAAADHQFHGLINAAGVGEAVRDAVRTQGWLVQIVKAAVRITSRPRDARSEIVENIQLGARIGDYILLRNSGIGLRRVDSGDILDDAAHMAIDKTAAEGKLVAELLLVTGDHFILIFRSRSAVDQFREGWVSLEREPSARYARAAGVAGSTAPIRRRKVWAIPHTGIFVERANHAGLEGECADRNIRRKLFVEPAPIREEFGFALAGGIDQHAYAGSPVVSKRVVQELTMHLLLIEPGYRLEGAG
jgi:hypothetical protein